MLSILVSGDSGFYSAAKKFAGELENFEVKIFAEFQPLVTFFSKLKIDYEKVKIFSMHGRELDIVGIVRRNRWSFFFATKN